MERPKASAAVVVLLSLLLAAMLLPRPLEAAHRLGETDESYWSAQGWYQEAQSCIITGVGDNQCALYNGIAASYAKFLLWMGSLHVAPAFGDKCFLQFKVEDPGGSVLEDVAITVGVGEILRTTIIAFDGTVLTGNYHVNVYVYSTGTLDTCQDVVFDLVLMYIVHQ